MYTRYRPGSEMNDVILAPFVPRDSLDTCTRTSCPLRRRASIDAVTSRRASSSSTSTSASTTPLEEEVREKITLLDRDASLDESGVDDDPLAHGSTSLTPTPGPDSADRGQDVSLELPHSDREQEPQPHQ